MTMNFDVTLNHIPDLYQAMAHLLIFFLAKEQIYSRKAKCNFSWTHAD